MNLCSDVQFLETIKVVKIVISVITIAIPLVLIVSSMISFAKATVGDPEKMPEVIKKNKNKFIAAISVFLVPVIVNTVMTLISATTDYESCLGNANSSSMAAIALQKAEAMLPELNEFSTVEDVTYVIMLTKYIEDIERANEISNEANVVLDKIVALKSPQDPGTLPTGPGTGTLPTPGGSSTSGNASCRKICNSSEPDPSAVINCWPGIVRSSDFIYPTNSSGQKLGSWPKNYSSIPTQLTNPKTYLNGTFIIPITPVSSTYSHVYNHNGIDFMAVYGTPVYSPVDGTITYSTWGHTGNKCGTESSYSISISMSNPATFDGKTISIIFLTHMSGVINRCEGCNIPVKKGQLIGFSGNAAGAFCEGGSSCSAGWAPHLHMTMYNASLQTNRIETLYGLVSGQTLNAGG